MASQPETQVDASQESLPPDVGSSDAETLQWGTTPNKPMEPARTQNNAGTLETPEKPMEPDEDPELPPDVDSDDADNGDGMEVSELHCVCKRGCAKNIGDTFVEEERMNLLKMKDTDKANLIFFRIRDQTKLVKERRKRVSWYLKDQEVCKHFWCHANACSRSTADEYRKLLTNGHTTIPPMLPKVPGPRGGVQSRQAEGAGFM